MAADDDRTDESPLLLVWRVAHVAATVVVPWMLTIRFFAPDPARLRDVVGVRPAPAVQVRRSALHARL
ncbi:hypothetical protein [Gordonia phthalatica]|uniref:hypothetical protein n=1 Tax=Gordonia phthalatica TaxID=1136941 RepID=UPI00138F78DF|nr:hypothetical protein [Gordonia phthalatica]